MCLWFTSLLPNGLSQLAHALLSQPGSAVASVIPLTTLVLLNKSHSSCGSQFAEQHFKASNANFVERQRDGGHLSTTSSQPNA